MSQLREIYDTLVKQYGNPTDTVHTFCDKGTDHTYIDFYAHHFARYKENVTLLEIGIMTGGSLLLWANYFDKYDLTGIDYSPNWSSPRPFQQEVLDNSHIDLEFSVNSKDPVFAAGYPDATFDLIIDDGDHAPDTQIETFRNYFLKTKPGGTYFIEDVRGKTEIEFLLREIRAWLDARKIQAGVDVYRGNVEQRKDDNIIFINRV